MTIKILHWLPPGQTAIRPGTYLSETAISSKIQFRALDPLSQAKHVPQAILMFQKRSHQSQPYLNTVNTIPEKSYTEFCRWTQYTNSAFTAYTMISDQNCDLCSVTPPYKSKYYLFIWAIFSWNCNNQLKKRKVTT